VGRRLAARLLLRVEDVRTEDRNPFARFVLRRSSGVKESGMVGKRPQARRIKRRAHQATQGQARFS
jgi:hypothetical protein